jgi:hypothetical protein
VVIPQLTRKKLDSNKSGHKGVFIEYNKHGVPSYKAAIDFKGTAHYLGRFSDLDSAVRDRKEAEKLYFQPYIDSFNNKNPPPTS